MLPGLPGDPWQGRGAVQCSAVQCSAGTHGRATVHRINPAGWPLSFYGAALPCGGPMMGLPAAPHPPFPGGDVIIPLACRRPMRGGVGAGELAPARL
jgi:hypothetical protein